MVGKQGESKWAVGVGHGRKRVCAPKFLGPHQHHRPPLPPLQRGISGLKNNEWQRCNVRPTGKRRERLAGCQMLRCSEARCHTAARSLVPPSIKLCCFPPAFPFFDICLPRHEAQGTSVLLIPEADEATDRQDTRALPRMAWL